MRRSMRGIALALALCLLGSAALADTAGPAPLDEAAYQTYYALSELLCADWDTDSLALLRGVEEEYGKTAEELILFLVAAAAADPDHVWIPVHGGTKYHRHADCSGMVDPRPATRLSAAAMGFDACKRCKP